jgi:hypothetical protein
MRECAEGVPSLAMVETVDSTKVCYEYKWFIKAQLQHCTQLHAHRGCPALWTSRCLDCACEAVCAYIPLHTAGG